MSEEREAPIVLPVVPEPILPPAEKAELSKLYSDPAFWAWFESQPEPVDYLETCPRCGDGRIREPGVPASMHWCSCELGRFDA